MRIVWSMPSRLEEPFKSRKLFVVEDEGRLYLDYIYVNLGTPFDSIHDEDMLWVFTRDRTGGGSEVLRSFITQELLRYVPEPYQSTLRAQMVLDNL